MVKEGKIGTFEAMWTLSLFFYSKLFLMFPTVAIELGGSAGWIIPVISSLTGLVGLYIIVSLLKRFPGQTIIEAGQSAAGPVIGFIAAVFYLAFFITSVSVATREFSESIKVMALPSTPLYVITLFFLIAMMVCVYLGLEAMSRMGIIIAISALAMIILLTVLLIPLYNIGYLFPLLGKGPAKLALWGMIKSSNFSELLFAGLIVNALGGWKNALKAGTYAVFLSMLVTTVIVMAVILTIGPTMGEAIFFPVFRITKQVIIRRFFQRLESVFLIFWILVWFLYCAFGLYASVITFTRMFKLAQYKPLIPVFAVTIFALAMLPHDMAESFWFDNYVLRNISWSASFAVPLVLLAIAAIRRKKNYSVTEE
jgi:spore germination protein KB